MLVPPAGQHPRQAPDETAGDVLAHVYAVRDAPTLDAARVAADRVVNTYQREYPAAVACFTDLSWAIRLSALASGSATR